MTVQETGKSPHPEGEARSMTVQELGQALSREVGRLLKGQPEVVDQAVIGLLVRGHVLLEGVPGLGKTLLAKALASLVRAEYRRVQFTPDLMPSDLTGVRVYLAHEERFQFQPGPVFTNFLLADEINRTPPKTQAALLEAMEERRVTVDGAMHRLPEPFFVMATQNPIEHEGTYPLPESQIDRFLMKIVLDYPAAEAEREILRLHQQGLDPHDPVASGLQPLCGTEDLETAAREIQSVQVEDQVLDYVVQLVGATRRSPQVMLGASPRAGVALLQCARARAALQGRDYTTPDDVKGMVRPVLRHRILLRPEAELEGLTADRFLEARLASVPVPR